MHECITLASRGRALLVVVLALAGCHDEPTIVVRFDPPGAGPRDASITRIDAATKADAAAAAAPSGECSRDGDCVIVKADCCGCSAGGKAMALARAGAARRSQRQAERCRETMCPQVMSEDASCRAVAVCREHRCALAPPPRH